MILGQKKILVLGGGGFIGSAITDQLLNNGHFVRVFERSRTKAYRPFEPHEKIDWMIGDFISAHDIENALTDIDIVIHLVSTTLPSSSNDDPIHDVQSNVVSTLQLLNGMRKKNTKKIIYASSGGTIYGNPILTPINEMHPTNPICSYGITKLTIEKYLLLYQELYNIEPAILRISNPYGKRQPTDKAQGAIGIFLHHALKNETIDIWGDGSISRDYIHISDVADAFLKLTQYEGKEVIFNIGSGQGTSINDLIQRIEEITGNTISRRYLPSRNFDIPLNILDITRAKKLLGWKPKISLRDGLIKTVNQTYKTVSQR